MIDDELPSPSDLFRDDHANRRQRRRQHHSQRLSTKPPLSLDRERIGSNYVHNPLEEISSLPSASVHAGRSLPGSPPSSPRLQDITEDQVVVVGVCCLHAIFCFAHACDFF